MFMRKLKISCLLKFIRIDIMSEISVELLLWFFGEIFKFVG